VCTIGFSKDPNIVNDRRKNPKSDTRQHGKRSKKRSEEYRIESRNRIPAGAVPADISQQVPNNSYSAPPSHYVDQEFVCVDCGRKEIWTALQQKWYYEVAKGSLYARAVRCRECRRKLSERHNGRGDPNPIKHIGALMKRIRSGIEPILLEAGFQFVGKDYFTKSRLHAWIDYSRPDMLFRCGYDRSDKARLIAEIMDEKVELKTIADMRLSYSPQSPLLERVDEFSDAVRQFLRTLQ
jgi:hypothetical protein